MKFKKIFTGLISLAAALFAVCAITVCAGAERSGKYVYEILDDGTISITGYSWGNETENEIPSTLDGKKVTRIGDSAFHSSYLTSIHIPDSVTSIGCRAFEGCSRLKSITIPNGVTSIEEYTFSDCSSLTSIDIPDSVTCIGPYAFYGCSRLTYIDIPDSVTNIGDWAFCDCSNLATIKMSNGVKSIGNWLFYECSSLTSIDIPDGVTNIGDGAFYYCSSLTSVKLPDSLKSIGDCAFEICKSLTSINLPNCVTSIGGSSFEYCESLISINIPDSVTSIGVSAFYDTPFLDNQTTTVKYGGKWVIECYNGATTATIKNGTKGIASGAFSGCTNLTSITIPDSVMSIGRSAFSGCTNLTSITIPDSVTSIGKNAFFECSSLKDVYYAGSKEQWNKIDIGSNNFVWLGDTATVHFGKVDAPSSVTGLNLKGRSGDALRLTWAKNDSADGYIIEMKDGTKWTRVGKITNNSTVEFKKSKLKAGTAYTFRVKAYKMDGKTALYSGYTTISARTNPSATTGLKLKASAADAVRLTWTKNTSADGYIIEMKDGTKWTRVGKITNNSTVEFKKSKLKAGTAYTFRVKAYKMSGKTALYGATKTISVRTNPSVVTGLKLKNSAKDAIRLSWTKNTSADGYIIEMKNGNSWTRAGKITKNSTVEFKKSGLKPNTSYTFRVKTYKMSGKTALYGATKTITVKTK